MKTELLKKLFIFSFKLRQSFLSIIQIKNILLIIVGFYKGELKVLQYIRYVRRVYHVTEGVGGTHCGWLYCM